MHGILISLLFLVCSFIFLGYYTSYLNIKTPGHLLLLHVLRSLNTAFVSTECIQSFDIQLSFMQVKNPGCLLLPVLLSVSINTILVTTKEVAFALNEGLGPVLLLTTASKGFHIHIAFTVWSQGYCLASLPRAAFMCSRTGGKVAYSENSYGVLLLLLLWMSLHFALVSLVQGYKEQVFIIVRVKDICGRSCFPRCPISLP